MSAKRVAKVHQAEWHRNGIGGEGFYAVLFDDPENGLMLGVLFDEPGCCAVFSVPRLAGPEGVLFGQNSWRGDHYEGPLRAAVKRATTGRLGPFSLPACMRTKGDPKP